MLNPPKVFVITIMVLVSLTACGKDEPILTQVSSTLKYATATGTVILPTNTLTPLPINSEVPPTNTITPPTAISTDSPPPTFMSTTSDTRTSENGSVAFTSERSGNAEIYIMNLDGGDEIRLTNNPAYDGWPSWSPDGSQIAFMSERSGNPDIYVMNADGSNLRQLTNHPANDIWPEWSPDGKWIAFPSRRDGNFEIYLINPDGTRLQRLTNTPSHEDFPAWSPDGKQLVFTRVEGDDGTYIINIDSGDPFERKLFDFRVFEPAWSPDGAQIVFGSNHEYVSEDKCK